MSVLSHARRTVAVAATLLATTAGTASAQTVVAGWDFSQYIGAGALTVDGMTFAIGMESNYSDFDPTFGVGIESWAFGTMYNDGTNGSTDAIVSMQTIDSTSGVIFVNVNAPFNGVPMNDLPFNDAAAFTIQSQEAPAGTATINGMRASSAYQDLSLLISDPTDLVFKVDRTTANPAPASDDWQISFGAKTALVGDTTIAVDFREEGGQFQNDVGSAMVTTTEGLFEIDLPDSSQDVVYVRLSFPGATMAGNEAILDNVAVTLPEPTAGLAGGGVLLTLGALARARRRSRA